MASEGAIGPISETGPQHTASSITHTSWTKNSVVLRLLRRNAGHSNSLGRDGHQAGWLLLYLFAFRGCACEWSASALQSSSCPCLQMFVVQNLSVTPLESYEVLGSISVTNVGADSLGVQYWEGYSYPDWPLTGSAPWLPARPTRRSEAYSFNWDILPGIMEVSSY